MQTTEGMKSVPNNFQLQKLLITCAASRVLTRSKGYVAEAEVTPAKPPPIKCTKRFALELPL